MADDEREKLEKRLGTVLKGKWKLEKLLGFGGMAAVYLARHQIGTEVAVKLVHPEVARSKELRMRFEQEARVMARLKHPGAVEVRDVDHTAEGLPFLVMELLHGEPLSQRMRRLDSVPIEDVLRFMDELLDVLSAAHKQGIVHRDIKLDNLFITDAGNVKVLDFGIARVRDAIALTMVGARLGTLPYMPPEQVTGKAVDGRADIFAVGAVMFRLVAKRRIHEAKSEQELLVKMTSEPAPPLAAVAPNAPAALCCIVDRALAFDKNRRYPDAATMQADVQALRKGQEPPYATQRLASEGPPNPLSDASPHSAAPKTMATAVASPLAKQADPLSATGLAPAGAVPADPLSDTGLAPGAGVPPDRVSDTKLAPPTPAQKHASHPHAKLESTQVASAGAVGFAAASPAVAVAVETVDAELPPGSATAAATPFEAQVASVRQLASKTAVLASSEAQIAKHTMVSSGPVVPASPAAAAQVAVMDAAPSSAAAPTSAALGQAPLSGNVAMAVSQPAMSDPLNQTLGSATASPLAGPISAAAPVAVEPKRDDTRMPAAVWLSIAGAVLLMVVIGAFIAWPSAADETVAGSDGAVQAPEETASEGDGDSARRDAVSDETAAANGSAAASKAAAETAAEKGSEATRDTAPGSGEVAGSQEAADEPLAREPTGATPTPTPSPTPKTAPSPASAVADEKAKERQRKEEEKQQKQAEKEAKKQQKRGGRSHGH